MPIKIPGQLEYLRSTFAELAKFNPEDLGDYNPDAIDLVETAIRQRIAGMPANEATAAVQSDAELLSEWSSSSDAPPSAAYVQGVLFGMLMWADFSEFTNGA